MYLWEGFESEEDPFVISIDTKWQWVSQKLITNKKAVIRGPVSLLYFMSMGNFSIAIDYKLA